MSETGSRSARASGARRWRCLAIEDCQHVFRAAGKTDGVIACSLLLDAPGTLRWHEEELPAPKADQILVRTERGAVSIGSELPFFDGVTRAFSPTSYPKMTGYESIGRVVAVGSRVDSLTVGDRVVAFYGHRTAALLPTDSVIKVPAEMDDDLALLVILTCDVAKGLAKLRPETGEPILVTGAGAIGLLTVWMLDQQGYGPIDIVEPIASRRDCAQRLGARHAWLPADAPGIPAYRFGVECSSTNAGFASLQRAMAPDGRICILADGLVEPLTLAPEFHERELLVVGSSDGLDYHTHAEWYFPTVLRHGAELCRLFDMTVDAVDLPATFEHLAATRHAAIKVLVRYDADRAIPTGRVSGFRLESTDALPHARTGRI